MKVDNSTLHQTSGTSSKPAGAKAARVGEQVAGNGKPSDEVSLTPLAAQLHAADKAAEAAPAIDTAKVEAIKQAIREGRFKINPEAIADRLLATVQELVVNGRNEA